MCVPDSFYLIKYRQFGQPALLVWHQVLAADMSRAKATDVAPIDWSVPTTTLNHRFVVAPVIRIFEPAMNHHVAGETQVELIGLAGGEWFAVVLSVRIDDAPMLTTGGALSWTFENS